MHTDTSQPQGLTLAQILFLAVVASIVLSVWERVAPVVDQLLS